MKYKSVPIWDDRFNMSSLCGYVETTYDRLVEVLGPDGGGGDKTTAEWGVEFEDGSVATIYDWKVPSTPRGVYSWHVGGHDTSVVEKVRKILRK